MCVFAYMTVSLPLVYLVPVEGETGHQILVKLEVQTVVNCRVGAGNCSVFVARATSA